MSSDCRKNAESPAPIEGLNDPSRIQDGDGAAADPGLEEELRELAAEYAPKSARERSLVATIILAERELRKLEKISRLSATPCDSAAFTRSFNTSRNAKNQADKAFDRLRAAAAPTATSKKKTATKAEPERPFVPEPGYGPRIRDTRFQVGHVTSLMLNGWADVYILRTCPGLTAEDLRYCREELDKGTVPRDLPMPEEIAPYTDLLPPLIGLLLALLLVARGLTPTPARLADAPASQAAPAQPTSTTRAVADRAPAAIDVGGNPRRAAEPARPSIAARVVRHSARADHGLRQRRATPPGPFRIDLVAIRREKGDNLGIESGPGRHSQASPRRSRAMDARSRRWRADDAMGGPSG
jgi:hypothetical protein